MNLDLMKQKTSMEALARRYENFAVPAVRIRIDGKEITKTCGAVLESLRVRLSLDDSGSADFSLIHVYDAQSRSFQEKVKSLVKLGSRIKVEMGYSSELVEVFVGFVYSIRYQIGDVPSLSVAAMDVKRLMAENQKHYYNYDKKKGSEVVEEILKTYKPMFSKAAIKTTPAEKNPDFEQNGSDLDFIQTLCRRSNREFIVCGSKLYFRESKSVRDPILILENGGGLLSFSREVLYREETLFVVVRKDDKDVLRAERKIPQRGDIDEGEVSSLGIPISKYIVETDIKTKNQVGDRLDKECLEIKKQSQSGSGRCIGLPDLIPGRYIRIEKMDKKLDGKYYLKQVEHSYGSDGFETSFEVGGYEK